MAGFRQTPIEIHSSQKLNDLCMHEWYNGLTLLSSTSSFSTVGCSAVLVASTVGCSVVTAMTNKVMNLRTSKTGWWVVLGVWKRDGRVVVVCNELHAWNVNQSSKRRREKNPQRTKRLAYNTALATCHPFDWRADVQWAWCSVVPHSTLLLLLRKPFPWLPTTPTSHGDSLDLVSMHDHAW